MFFLEYLCCEFRALCCASKTIILMQAEQAGAIEALQAKCRMLEDQVAGLIFICSVLNLKTPDAISSRCIPRLFLHIWAQQPNRG